MKIYNKNVKRAVDIHDKLSRLFGGKTAASLMFIAIVMTLSIFLASIKPHNISPVFSGADAPVLIIDAGHGGIDGGAVGVDGSRESDINLAIALRLEALCNFFGLDTLMTRVDDSRGNDSHTYSEHAELVYRTELANSVENGVFISIHQNCYPTAQPSGPQVLYSDDDMSKRLGLLTHRNLVMRLDPSNRRLAEPDNNDIYVLNHVDCPAILVECGFVSNHNDISKLTTYQYQTAVSAVLMASFIQYSNENTCL